MPSKVHFSLDNNDKRTLPADLCLSTFCDREPFITCCKKIQAIYSSSRRAFLDADAGDSGGDHNDHDDDDNDDAQKNTPSTAHIVASTQVGQVHLGNWTSDKLSLVTTFCLRSPSLPLCVTSPANDPLGAVGN